jgi:hypothetical protein
MLACVGLFVILSGYSDYSSKPTGPIYVNPCAITRMYDHTGRWSQTKMLCTIFMGQSSEDVAESCEQVKVKIYEVKGK